MDSKIDEKHVESQSFEHLEKNDDYKRDVLANPDHLNEAFEGENQEHAQGMVDAVKTHPMACFWAFVFSFTIVSFQTWSL